MSGVGMTSRNDYIALEVNGEQLSLRELLRFAKWSDQSRFLKSATDALLIRQAAMELGVQVSNEECQQAADRFRVERDLYTAEKTERWLALHHLSFPEWEALLEDEIIRLKLRNLVVSNQDVEKYFVEHRLAFDAASISRLVVRDECVARELRAQIVEDGADFYSLTRNYSIDLSSRPAGGYVGLMRRSEMEPTMESAIFGAKVGMTVGPVKTYSGWQLVKVEAQHLAILDDSMRETIKSLLFEEWLRVRRVKATVNVPLFELDPEDASIEK